MALERKWSAISPRPITADCTALGVVTVADTAGFRTKQKVVLQSDTQQPTELQVQEVLSPQTLVVGKLGPKVGRQNFTDVSRFLVIENAKISATEQDKNNIPDKDHYAAIYEADPVIADRVISVDQYGQFYSADNPMPINIGGGGGIAPSDFDDVKITRDSDDDPILYTFYKALAVVGQVEVLYNTNKSAIEYKKI